MVDSPRGRKYRPQYWKWPQLRQRGPALLEEVHAAEEQEQDRDVTGRGVSPRWLQRLQPRQRQELCWHSQFTVVRSRQLRFSGTGTPNISEIQLLSRHVAMKKFPPHAGNLGPMALDHEGDQMEEFLRGLEGGVTQRWRGRGAGTGSWIWRRRGVITWGCCTPTTRAITTAG